jgi:hypothetical protein
MSRIFLWCIPLLAIPNPGRAEQAVTEAETLIRLGVQPMAAPQPALRYLLLPELKEMSPGNPIPNYLRAVVEQEASGGETFSRSALRQADRAARMDRPDWQILPRLKTDGIGLLIPDVAKLRALASGLQGRFHEEVTQHRLGDARETAKTMFALSRHLAEHPTLIGDLVGMAAAFLAIGGLEEMLEQPGSPNLYWALTSLPNPLVSLEMGLQGERMLIRSEFRELDDRTPMNEDQIKKLISHIDGLRRQVGDFNQKVEGTRAWLDARARNEEVVHAARRSLIEYGVPEDRLLRFPADQVMLLEAYRIFEVHRDEGMKLAYLPTWQIDWARFVKQQQGDRGPFGTVLPALHKVRRAQARLEQRIALLRHVEALRLYAAEHGGDLPRKLSDCGVPLPADPATGKAFQYEVEGVTAHLRGSPLPGEEKNPAYNIHYEVTIRN